MYPVQNFPRRDKMLYKFTNKAKKAIEIADEISLQLGHN